MTLMNHPFKTFAGLVQKGEKFPKGLSNRGIVGKFFPKLQIHARYV